MIQIRLLLRFNIQTANGAVVGTAHVDTKANDGNFPQKEERVTLCSGNTNVNIVLGTYDIRVIDVCRNLGGEFVTTILCNIGFSTWNQHTGEDEAEILTSEEVVSHWRFLKEYFDDPSAYDIDNCSFTFYNLNKV